MPPTPAELSDLLTLVADQSRIAEQVGRVAEALDEQARELSVLRSTLNSMVEDRHLHLLPALEANTAAVNRMREDIKEALAQNADDCQTRRDKLDRVMDEIRARGHRQDALAKQPSGDSPKVEGLAFTWSQRIPAATVAKWIAWAAVTAGSFFGGARLMGKSTTPASPPALTAPKGTP